MAYHPMWRPDSEEFAPSDPAANETVPQEAPPASDPYFRGIEGSAVVKPESDFAELAAKFAAHGGGKIPPELSGELVLDVVLNEIVEHACSVTGATGAAIALARGEEMVCRASSGGTAPELGTRLDMHSGLSGACVRSRQMQRCDDALADPRADAEVSRQLGVRSVVVWPLLQDEQLIGIFEIFSERPSAFGERDGRTLELLSGRVLKNTQALQSSLLSQSLEPLQTAFESAGEGAGYDSPAARGETHTIAVAGATVPRFDWLTTLMGGIIVAVALLMGAAFAMHMGWLKAGGQRRVGNPAAAASVSSAPTTPPIKPATEPARAEIKAPESVTLTNAPKKFTTAQSEPGKNPQVPEGGLRVYENGKEIFRMPPSEPVATGTSALQNDASTDGAAKPENVVELPPTVAEGSLVRRVEPEYPEEALLRHVQGPVLLDVHIGEEGAVREIKVVKGPPLLAEAAMAAVRQWRFKPYTVNGRAVEMETRITLTFTLPPS
ncbi:MAG: TonB family protein [Candidatus Sulfotelmatobacter sp.]